MEFLKTLRLDKTNLFISKHFVLQKQHMLDISSKYNDFVHFPDDETKSLAIDTKTLWILDGDQS